jgi:hypothetical protein
MWRTAESQDKLARAVNVSVDDCCGVTAGE